MKKYFWIIVGCIRSLFGKFYFCAEYFQDGQMWITEYGSLKQAKMAVEFRKKQGASYACIVMRWSRELRIAV